MKMLKKTICAALALILALSLASCGKKAEEAPAQEVPAQEAPSEEPVTTRIAALKGPTAMGMVKLMHDDPQSG